MTDLEERQAANERQIRALRLVRRISGLAILFVLAYIAAGVVRYYL